MSAFGVKRPSLAALTKVPNPLEAEEEAEQYGKIPHKIGVRPQQNHIPPRPRQRIAPDWTFRAPLRMHACDALTSRACPKENPGRFARRGVLLVFNLAQPIKAGSPCGYAP